jgi:putative tryptophan/tyrosine transport system substrate-binding protein
MNRLSYFETISRVLTAMAAAILAITLLLLSAWTNETLAQSAAGAQVQPQKKPFRIYSITFRGKTEVERGFKDYFASRRIPVEIIERDIERDNTKIPGLLEEIRRIKPDLIYTWGTSVTLGVVGSVDNAKDGKFINDIPVVFTLVAAPVSAKITPTLASSERNVTGVYHVASTETQIRAMSSYRPFKTMGVLYTSSERNSVVTVEELRSLSKKMNFTLVERKFALDPATQKPTAEGAADLIRDMKQNKVDWLYLPPDSFLGTQAKSVIIPAATEVGLPTFASTEQLMETGALAGLVSRYYNIGQFTAYKAEQILTGKKTAKQIPIETLTRFSFQVQMAEAAKLKLYPPLTMFNYAEFIVPPPPPPMLEPAVVALNSGIARANGAPVVPSAAGTSPAAAKPNVPAKPAGVANTTPVKKPAQK